MFLEGGICSSYHVSLDWTPSKEEEYLVLGTSGKDKAVGPFRGCVSVLSFQGSYRYLGFASVSSST